MDEISPVREGGHERDWEPVALGFAQTSLVLHVVRQVAQRVALRLTAIVSNFFIAAGKGNRLEAQEADGLGIVQCKLDNAAYLLIVDAVDDCGDRNDINASFMQVMNGAQLHIKQIANLAM